MSRITLSCRLRTVSLLTVGMAYPEYGVDVPFQKVGKKIAILGSTVKGVLRSSASRAASWLGMASCNKIEPSEMVEEHERMRKMGRRCDVCNLFGMPGDPLPSRIKVHMFEVASEIPEPLPRLTNVSLEDATLKASKGKLFTREIVPLNTEFNGQVTFLLRSDDTKSEASLLKLLLASLLNMRFEPMGKGGFVDVKVDGCSCRGIGEELLKEHEIQEMLSALKDWWYR